MERRKFLKLAIVGAVSGAVWFTERQYHKYDRDAIPDIFEIDAYKEKNKLLRQEIKQKLLFSERKSPVSDLLKDSIKMASKYYPEPSEALRNSLFCLTEISFGNKEAGGNFPPYIPSGREKDRGFDKTGHLLSAAFFAFELLRLANEQPGLDNEFLKMTNLATSTVGQDNIELIKNSLCNGSAGEFPFCDDFSGLDETENQVAKKINDAGIAYEVFSTFFDNDQKSYINSALLHARMYLYRKVGYGEIITDFINEALSENNPDIYEGLCDSEVSRDLFANQVGVCLGISLFRQRNSKKPIINIPLDVYGIDRTEKYPPIPNYLLGVNADNLVVLTTL